MKIAISGTANTGKSTLIREFINNWTNYKTPVESYRDVLKSQPLTHSDKTNEETQTAILDFWEKQLNENSDEEYVIYDRSPLDVLVYTIAAAEQDQISDEFVADTILRVKKMLSHYDIIFVLPFNDAIPIEDDGFRVTNVDYIKKIDTIFLNLVDEYYQNFDNTIFFPKENCPGVIVLETLDRVTEIKGLLNKFGNLYSVEEEKIIQEDAMKYIASRKEQRQMLENLIEKQSTTKIEMTPELKKLLSL